MSCRSITSPSCWAGFAAAVAAVGVAACRAEEPAILRAAAAAFTVMPTAGDSLATLGLTGAAARRVIEPLESVVFLLESEGRRHVLVTTHFSTVLHVNASAELRRIAAAATGAPVERVWIFSSHNHSDLLLATNGLEIFQLQTAEPPPIAWNPVGERFVTGLRETAARLPDRLVPVTVHHAVATEDRLTYNRKGRRADGSTYFMREEDRLLVATDYRGDVDTQAPLVVFKDEAGHAVAALAQFTGHPVTSYNPERPVVHGDWPQTACRVVAAALAERDAAGAGPAGRTVPVGFPQGCAGDVNSKGMFAPDGPARAEEFGRMLGGRLVESIPRLVAAVRPWYDWALEQHATGRADTLPRALDVEVVSIRLGDVGIVGFPCEPFQGIGRLARASGTLPLTIACGYANLTHGYIPDGPNVGDREYMSSFHRYTRFRPPFARPAGDVMALRGVEALDRMIRGE